MWPAGLGLMLYNGANGLIYYSGQASRVFISNAGIIATVAVSGYFFPEETLKGLGGAVVIRGATWLTKAVDNKYHVHIADGVDKLLFNVLPTSVRGGYVKASHTLKKPQAAVSTAIANQPRLHWVNDSLATELLSPMLEEVIFRGGLQQGLALGLAALGVPEKAATFLALAISSSLFAGAHDLDPRSKTYRDTFVAGIGFGYMMYLHGMPAAVVSHAANNACVRLEKALRD